MTEEMITASGFEVDGARPREPIEVLLITCSRDGRFQNCRVYSWHALRHPILAACSALL